MPRDFEYHMDDSQGENTLDRGFAEIHAWGIMQ